MSQLSVPANTDVLAPSARRSRRPNVPGVIGTIFTLIMAALWIFPFIGRL